MSVIISIYDDILHKFKKRALTSIPVGDHRIFNQHWPDWLANLGEDGRKLLAEDLKTVSKHGGAIIANNMLEMFRIRDEEQKESDNVDGTSEEKTEDVDAGQVLVQG